MIVGGKRVADDGSDAENGGDDDNDNGTNWNAVIVATKQKERG